MRNLILIFFLLLSATVGLAQNPAQSLRSASRDAETNTPAKFVLEQGLPQGPSPLVLDRSGDATNVVKKITLEQIAHSLETLTPRIEVPEPIRSRARQAITRMLDIK